MPKKLYEGSYVLSTVEEFREKVFVVPLKKILFFIFDMIEKTATAGSELVYRYRKTFQL